MKYTTQTTSKRTTITTTRTAQKAPTTSTGGKEKTTETTVKRRSEGTGSKTETKLLLLEEVVQLKVAQQLKLLLEQLPKNQLKLKQLNNPL